MSRSKLGPMVPSAFSKNRFFRGSDQVSNILRNVKGQLGFKIDTQSSTLSPIVHVQNENYLPMQFLLNYKPNDLENIDIKRETKTPGAPYTWSVNIPPQRSGNGETGAQYEQRYKEAVAKKMNLFAGIAAKQESDKRKPEVVLTMWINPRDFNGSYNKVHTNTLTRGDEVAYARHYWGDQQPSLTLTGRTPAFYTEKTGLTRVKRASSAAWHHMMAILALFKNNGWVIAEDGMRIQSVGDVIITYDARCYAGSFRTISITEEAEAPFVASYNIQFKVRREWRI